MRFGALWDLPTESKMKWFRRRCRILRIYLEILDSGWDPDLRCPLAGERTYAELITLAVEHGIELMPCFARHDPGNLNGTGYHSRLPPVLDHLVVGDYADEFLSWLHETHPSAELYALQDSNELGYLPNLGDASDVEAVYEKWNDGFSYIRALAKMEGVPVVIGGNRAFRRRRGGPTLIEWCAENDIKGPDVIVDIHGNSLSDNEFHDHIAYARELGFRVGCYEDASMERAEIRARIARVAGAVAYFPFGRFAPEKWGVSKHKKTDTTNLGIQQREIWNVANAKAFDRASKLLGEKLKKGGKPVDPIDPVDPVDPVPPPLPPSDTAELRLYGWTENEADDMLHASWLVFNHNRAQRRFFHGGGIGRSRKGDYVTDYWITKKKSRRQGGFASLVEAARWMKDEIKRIWPNSKVVPE